METFQALVSNDHIYSVINIVLVIQRVSVEVRGELSTKPWLVRSTPPFGKNGLITECIILHLLTTLTILTALKLSDHNTLLTFLITVFLNLDSA